MGYRIIHGAQNVDASVAAIEKNVLVIQSFYQKRKVTPEISEKIRENITSILGIMHCTLFARCDIPALQVK